MHDSEADLPALTAMPRGGIVAGHECLNAALRRFLLDMAARIPDRGTNKASGPSYFSNKWLSARDLFLLPVPAIRQLTGLVEAHANSLVWPHLAGATATRIHAMWAIISDQGMEGQPHQHSGTLSGVYYVDAGDCSDTNGAFVVHDAEGQPARRIVPADGLLLMFPSTLLHSVARYDSDRPRMVISFNLN